jgi:hypothetical protein
MSPISLGVLLGFFFNPEDGRAILFRYVGFCANYTVLQSRKPDAPCIDFEIEKLFPGIRT